VVQVYADEYTAGHSNGKAGNIYQRIKFPFHQVAPGDLEVVAEHDWLI
jgi:hypothetical protein